MPIQPIQDTIELQLSAEKIVTNETVKLVATITAQVMKDEPPDELPNCVRVMMKKVVADADWQFSNMQRQKDSTGYERVSLTASARVPEKENYNLDFRAESASLPGLMINDIEADTTIPAWMVEKAVADLRVELANKAKAVAASMSDALMRDYRVARLTFGNGDPLGGGKSLRANSSGFTATASYGTGTSEDGTLGNAQKVSVSATVLLAVIVPLHHSYIEATY